MGKKLIYSIVCLLFGLIMFMGQVYAQEKTTNVRLSGLIKATDSIQSTPYVHVINKRTGRGVISDSLGFFRTNIFRSDTLIFKCLGFADYQYTLPDSLVLELYFLNIAMSPTSYNLDVIDVIALSRRSQIKVDILSMEFEDGGWGSEMVMPGFYRSDYKLIRDNERPISLKAFSPVSAVYNAFGQEMQSLSKLEELMAQDIIDAVIEKKYNRNILKEFTSFHASKLDCFTMFLQFDNSFLYEKSDYHILYEVKNRMIPFEFQYANDSLSMLSKLP